MKNFPHIKRRTLCSFAATVVIACFSSIAPAQIKHPPTFIDKGACPFECCTYQRWTVEKDTIAYDQPATGAKRVGLFKKGSRVRGLTGHVITTQPGKFVITKPHGKYKPGNILWVYTPEGEGFYKVWFGGKMLVEEMDFMSGPYEQSGINCDERADCWGKLECVGSLVAAPARLCGLPRG